MLLNLTRVVSSPLKKRNYSVKINLKKKSVLLIPGNSIRDESIYSSSTQKQSLDSVTMSRGYSVNSHQNGIKGIADDMEGDVYLSPIVMDILKEPNAEDCSTYRIIKKTTQNLPLCSHNYQHKTVIKLYPRMKIPNGQCVNNVHRNFSVRETPLNDDDIDRDEVLFAAVPDSSTMWDASDMCYSRKTSTPPSDLPPTKCSHIYCFYHRKSNEMYDLIHCPSNWHGQDKTVGQVGLDNDQNSDPPSRADSAKAVETLETELDAYMKQLKLREKR